jgi:hypothetical protein
VTPKSIDATDAAARLWARVAGGATSPAEVAAAADLMCTQLRVELARWIGNVGYGALLARALTAARAEHPALDDISCLGGDASEIAAAMPTHGAISLSAGLVAVVAELVELLGRIIGARMAVQLVDQISLPSPRGVVSTKPQGGRDGD